MRLLLIHGRFDPNQSMDEWGFSGPDINGVEALHVTHQQTHVLYFEDAQSAKTAHALTGWPYFDENALELTFHDDMLKTVCLCADRPAMFFGDWELQAPR